LAKDFADPLQSGVNSGFFEQACIMKSKVKTGKENFSNLNFGEFIIDIIKRFT